MALIPTTTVTITRSTNTGDPYETAATSTPYSGTPAHISDVDGTDARVGGDQERITAEAYLPATLVLQRADRVTDERNGTVYAVEWKRLRTGLGLEHLHVGLRAVEGGSNG